MTFRALVLILFLLGPLSGLSGQLIDAIRELDAEAALDMLNRGADADSVVDGRALLFHACDSGDMVMIRLLLLNGADPDPVDAQGASPLVHATLAGDFDLSHLLLELGADPDLRDDLGAVPLLYAAASNYYELCDLLLFYGADPGTRDRSGNDALLTAVSFGMLETVDVLLQKGFDVNTRDQMGTTPLMIASQKGDREMCGLLLEYKATVNTADSLHYSPLAHAVRYDRYRLSSILLEMGADPNHLVRKGRSIYDLAGILGYERMQKLLESKGGFKGKGLDMSQLTLLIAFSVNDNDNMLQSRIQLHERNHKLYFETGFDFRASYLAIEVPAGEDRYVQYRELRSAWMHGVGRELPMVHDGDTEYGLYGALGGLLSWAKRKGFPDDRNLHYSLLPQLGGYMQGWLGGLRVGAEYYHFGTELEKGWKLNIGVFINLDLASVPDPWKEIEYQ